MPFAYTLTRNADRTEWRTLASDDVGAVALLCRQTGLNLAICGINDISEFVLTKKETTTKLAGPRVETWVTGVILAVILMRAIAP
jgi:hypothetical protein